SWALGPAGGACFPGNPAPYPAAQALAPLPALRATPRPAALPTLPKSASGTAGGGYSAGVPAPPPRRKRCQNWPSGLSGTAQPTGHPAPRPAAHVAFFFIGPSGVCLAG